METVNIIGAGLAGCEAAWQLAKLNFYVRLFEQKPVRFSPAHSNADLCELVCSNSLKSNSIDNACGLLKEELRRLGSLVIACADTSVVPAGAALAVDREAFSATVTQKLTECENIEIVREEVESIPLRQPCIVATGPLTSGKLAEHISELCGKHLAFFDAAAPIVTSDSIDMRHAWRGARYGKGDDDYINCPLTREQYQIFYDELCNATAAQRHINNECTFFEGCMPIEEAARRGFQTLTFGAFKPRGLVDPSTECEPFACLQLRQDNFAATLYSLVGCQTGLAWNEQRRVFSLIPALKNAEFARFGVMHRNTFINSPTCLTANFRHKIHENLFFAGQIAGTEGYVEAVAAGLTAALALAHNTRTDLFPAETVIGALSRYIYTASASNFQPTNAMFGLLPPLEQKIRDKKQRYAVMAQRSLAALSALPF